MRISHTVIAGVIAASMLAGGDAGRLQQPFDVIDADVGIGHHHHARTPS